MQLYGLLHITLRKKEKKNHLHKNSGPFFYFKTQQNHPDTGSVRLRGMEVILYVKLGGSQLGIRQPRANHRRLATHMMLHFSGDDPSALLCKGKHRGWGQSGRNKTCSFRFGFIGGFLFS